MRIISYAELTTHSFYLHISEGQKLKFEMQLFKEWKKRVVVFGVEEIK